jgi:hypothetical protein
MAAPEDATVRAGGQIAGRLMEGAAKSGDAGGTGLAVAVAQELKNPFPWHSNVRQRGRLRLGGRPDCRSRLSYSNIGGANSGEALAAGPPASAATFEVNHA